MYKKVHCIGIGGIGLSALARYHMDRGAVVSGSDIAESDLISDLREYGMEINIGNDADYVPDDADLVIYSIAINYDTDKEYLKAKEMQGPSSILPQREEATQHELEFSPLPWGERLGERPVLLSYPQALGELTREKKTIAICGTHGKTTTTAMTYYALKEAGIEASMIVGSLINIEKKDGDGNTKNKKTNYVYGDSEYLIIEACEYRRSFLNYNPTYILVTNIESEHLDYYRDLDDIESAFVELVNKLPEDGKVICHEAELAPLSESRRGAGGEGVLVNADDIINHFDIKLKVIGEHNQKNAQLVVALGETLGLDRAKILKGLENFLGTWRRMEYRGYAPNGAMVYDDYAHHPTEIDATLVAINSHYNNVNDGIQNKKIVLVFQPHLQSRTYAFYDQFIRALSMADIIYILPIYHAREEIDHGINNYKMVASIIDLARAEGKYKEVYTLDFANAGNELAKYDKNHIIITMGAGKNNIIADELVAEN